MWLLLGMLLGSIVGTGIAFFGPVLVFALLNALLNIGTGSYEDLLVVWFVSLPCGFVLGARSGYRVALNLRHRRPRRE